MKIVLLLCLLLLGLAATEAAFCHGSPSPDAKPNLTPVYTDAPVFVRSVANGALYTVGEGDDEIPVVHLWGSAYEKGLAHGQLMKPQVTGLITRSMAYFEEQVESAINGTGHSLGFPQDTIDKIAEIGLDAMLDLTFLNTEEFTGNYFYEEIYGLADGSGVDVASIRRLHMIGELTKGRCSMFGAWGNATRSNGGKLLQLRALDWAVDGPFKNYPQITIYHSTDKATQGYSFANVGWSGWVGSITGMSSQAMGISEIGVSYPDSTFGDESPDGVPFTNILRDVLQFDASLEEAQARMTNSNRTCRLILGVGDGKEEQFRSVAYSHSKISFFTDTNMLPNDNWHPRMDNVVYYGMDWLCPNYSTVLNKQLQLLHGNLTAENAIKQVTSITQTGDLHVAYYDLLDGVLHVANARGDTESGPPMAYDRQFVRIDLAAAWKLPPPTGHDMA